MSRDESANSALDKSRERKADVKNCSPVARERMPAKSPENASPNNRKENTGPLKPSSKDKKKAGTKTMLRVKYKSLKRKVKGHKAKSAQKGKVGQESGAETENGLHNEAEPNTYITSTPDGYSSDENGSANLRAISGDEAGPRIIRDVERERESPNDIDDIVVIEDENNVAVDGERSGDHAQIPPHSPVNSSGPSGLLARRRNKQAKSSLIANPAIVNGQYKGRENVYRNVGRALAKAREGQRRPPKSDNASWCGCVRRRSKRTGAGPTPAIPQAYRLTSSGASLRLKKTVTPSGEQKTVLAADTSTPSDYDVCHKILLLGDSNVGKTSILKHLLKETFNPNEPATVSFDHVTQMVNVDGARVMLQLWDLPGQERFVTLGKHYYRDSKAILLVYDITDLESFIFLGDKWLSHIEKEIDKHRQESIPVYIVGNKCDTEERYHDITPEQGQEFCEQHLCLGFFEISARTGHNLTEMFEKVALGVTEMYAPHLMDSYLSPVERAEKYKGVERVQPNGGLGTAQVVERQPEATTDKKSGRPADKRNNQKSSPRRIFCSCLRRNED